MTNTNNSAVLDAQDTRITETTIKKAVFLANGERSRLMPLTKRYPAFLLPVFNKPLIEHNIDLLKRKGIQEVIVVLPKSTGTEYVEYINELRVEGIKICSYEENKPRGTAGILGDIRPLIDNQPFFVIQSGCYLEDIDLDGLIKFHKDREADVTIGIKQKPGQAFLSEESIEISHEGQLKEANVMCYQKDRRSAWTFSDIYLFSPSVLNYIDLQYYQDIKEQLIPILQDASLSIYAHKLGGYSRIINRIEDYIELHRDLFEITSRAVNSGNKKENLDQIWIGENSEISPDSFLLGPIFIGKDCKIAEGAQIIGPTIIGAGCKISEGTIVRESILWNDVSLKKGARIEYCILDDSFNALENERLKNLIAVFDLHIGDVNLIPQNYKLLEIGRKNLVNNVNHRIFNLMKRIIDISVSLILLISILPILLLIALLIKIDSPGPVFFIQKRCGKDGKMFNMIKFRTMCATAEKTHNNLIARKDTDGPMFKMVNDPRITRLGRKLRETSLDELPQLINVIKNEMSLVGPRPLIMEEMKLSPSWRNMRLGVRPGITGLWQVQGRNEAPFHDWIKYDVDYVKNQSIWMDLKILFKTISVVFRKVGAY